MYTVDIINVQGKHERVFVNKDRIIREEAPRNEREREELVLMYAADPKYKRSSNEDVIDVNVYVVAESVSYAGKRGKHEPVYKRKTASEFVAYADGTYDYNEVVSQDYNEHYFDFSEYRKALKLA